MIYKGCEIKRNENNEYVIMAFKKQLTPHTYKSVKEAKGVIDNVIIPQAGKNRYIPCHSKHYIWTIIDNRTHLKVTLENGKLLKFTNRADAVKWCKENQESLE